MAGQWGTEPPPHYNTLLRCAQSLGLTSVLERLVGASSAPLVGIERRFAVDSTAFTTCVYESWNESKWGKAPKGEGKKTVRWVKAHACTGVQTHVITACQVTESFGEGTGDSPNLPPLVWRTVRNGFIADEVSADAAYLATANIEAIEAVGAVPFIAFKENTTGGSSPAMARLYSRFNVEREDYLRSYHRRSNCETAFGMLKARYNGFLRTRKPVAQYNEVLAKVICHNVACLVQAIHEFRVEPKFWAPPSTPGPAAQVLVLGNGS